MSQSLKGGHFMRSLNNVLRSEDIFLVQVGNWKISFEEGHLIY